MIHGPWMLENMRTIRIRWGPSRGIFEENIQFLNFQMEIMLTLVYLNLKTRVQSVSRARGVSSINYFLDNIFKTLKCRTVGRQNVLKDKNKLNNCIIWLGTIPWECWTFTYRQWCYIVNIDGYFTLKLSSESGFSFVNRFQPNTNDVSTKWLCWTSMSVPNSDNSTI